MAIDRPLGVANLPFIPGPAPLEIVGGEGCWLYTADGRRILDGAAGAIVTNIGHGRPELAELAAKLAQTPDYVIPPWATPARVALRDRLITTWLPEELTQVVFCSGGSEAVDSALRLARAHHLCAGRAEKWKVIGRWPSYHGATIATLAVGGHQSRRAGYEVLFPDFPHVAWDDPDALDAMIQAQGPDTVAAFIAEPIIGAAGGALVPPEDYFPRVAEICRRHDVLLIVDEVMSGLGRSGRNWGIEHWGVVPDIMIGTKGLAGGYAAIGGLFATRHVVDPIAAAGHNFMFFTFGAQSSACVVADKVLEIMEDENLVERSAKVGAQLKDRLDGEFADHPHVAEVRGLGLFLGLEFTADRDGGKPFPKQAAFNQKVVSEALARNLWVYPAGTGSPVQDAILVGPPFTINDDEIEILVTTLHEAIDAAAAAVG